MSSEVVDTDIEINIVIVKIVWFVSLLGTAMGPGFQPRTCKLLC